MKIKFSNLGAIKETELNLRPLTIIIGPNNSNKTYVAYSIYGLLQEFNDRSPQLVSSSKLKKVNGGGFSLSPKTFEDTVNIYCQNRVRQFKENLESFFQDSSQKLFSSTKLDVDINSDELINALKNVQGFKISQGLDVNAELSFQNNELLIKSRYKEAKEKLDDYSDLDLRLSFFLSLLLAKQLFPTPFLLPAERNAFVITYKMLANRRYKLLRQSQRELLGRSSRQSIRERQLQLFKEQGDVRYPQPIEDFLDFMTDVEFKQPQINPRQVSDFKRLADEIEKQIQGRSKTNFRPTMLGGKELKVNIRRGLDIDLYNASSSIKQLAPLLLYLRYRAAENDLLIIDEPEMNLHPESQAKLLEVLAILISLGVKVLLTTHSPYFMAHLNNLISSKQLHDQALKDQASALYLDDPRAFLSPDEVSAYEMRGNKLHPLKDEDYGIRWDTLSDVSAVLQQKFFEIDKKGKATPRATKKQSPKRSTKKKQQ